MNDLHDPKFRARARRHLRRTDTPLAPLVDRYPDPWPGRARSRFSALVDIILDQQISVHAAATIRRRLRAKVGRSFRHDALLGLNDAEFRAIGISRQKTAALRDLSERCARGSLPLRGLSRRDDEEIIEHLTQVRGIGRWSAEMFLLFAMGRPDVLSTGDLGLLNAAQRLYGLEERPDPDAFVALAEPWRPYRSVASWYLWTSLDLGNWVPPR